MFSKSLLPLAALLLLSAAGMGQARPHPAPGHSRALGKRIARAAPLIFIGRPLIGALHDDSLACRCLYAVTYIDVVQVLRGDLRPGKVELLDTLPAVMYRATSAMRRISRLPATKGFAAGTLGVYFAQPSRPMLATRLQAAAQPPRQLQSYERRPDAHIQINPTGATGLYRAWATPRHVWKFLAHLPNSEPVADSLKAAKRPLTVQ